MRIGLSTTVLEPAINGGHLDGIGVYTNHLMEGLLSRGHSVEGRSFPPLLKPGIQKQFVIGRCFSAPFSVLSGLALMTGGNFKLNPGVDLFHVTDYHVIPMRCPVIASLHDAIPMKYPALASSKLRSVKNFVQSSMARYADQVITLSQYTVRDLVEYYRIPDSRISVVPCGVGQQWLVSVPEDTLCQILRRRGLEAGYFLFVGTLQPRKNVQRILDAYLSLPESIRRERKLVIVGKAGWRCEALIQRLGELVQNGQATWLQDVQSDEELRAIYAGAGVFVFPSLFEGYGIPVLEAFASKVPVITSNTTSLPEASGGAALEINPESLDELVSAMELLATDAAERSRRIAAGWLRVQVMTWDATVERTLAVYRKVL